jgi:hypothetical protein
MLQFMVVTDNRAIIPEALMEQLRIHTGPDTAGLYFTGWSNYEN